MSQSKKKSKPVTKRKARVWKGTYYIVPQFSGQKRPLLHRIGEPGDIPVSVVATEIVK